jgi:hypothetical protein
VSADEAKAVLHTAAALRFPRLRDLGHAAKVAALEDYLAETAIARGELEEARLHLGELHHGMKAQWDDIAGWEMHVGVPASRRTQVDVRMAKKLCRPDLYAGLSHAKFLLDAIGCQIRRLEQDDAAASREYTIVTG